MGIADDDAVSDVHVRSYLYGYGRTVTATPEELDYMKRRLFAEQEQCTAERIQMKELYTMREFEMIYREKFRPRQ